MSADIKEIMAQAKWLRDNPEFDERPASISEFLGPEYLNIRDLVRPGLLAALEDIFGSDVQADRISQYQRAMVTGGIGIGKTTFASIALPYMAHWVLCLKDPQKFFKLLPGSRIAFMQMSTSGAQAREVVFGDIFARIKNAKWFIKNYPHDPKFTKQIRFPKDIWILPGDSGETTFEGYNILGGILDEMDSHKITDKKDYADVGFDTIESRIASRFTVQDASGGDAGHLGLIICIGQMKKASGFAARKLKEFQADKRAHVTRMTIWESLGWERFTDKATGERNSFFYDVKRKEIIPHGIGQMLHLEGRVDNLIEVPMAYHDQFSTNPEKALRDLAGIPPAVADPFIGLVSRIEEARDRWKENQHEESPVGTRLTYPDFAPWFRSNGDPSRRTVHIDLAVSAEGDALGLAMGHVSKLVEVDDELKPYVVIDCLIRMKAAPGGEIMLSDMRRIVYYMKDDLKFRIVSATMDGFQSTDTLQQFRKRRIAADYLSVDRTTLPYEDLREAIYEQRIEFPEFLTYVSHASEKPTEVAIKELMELQYTGKKVDHPAGGSKDLADAMAGVTYTLMGDRTYRRGVRSEAQSQANDTDTSQENDNTRPSDQLAGMFGLPTGPGSHGELKAPVPTSGASSPGIIIPPRLLRSNEGR